MNSLSRVAPCFLIAFAAACSGDTDAMDAGGDQDASATTDSGLPDEGGRDANAPTDTGDLDAGELDAGPADVDIADTGSGDLNNFDMGLADMGPADNGPADNGPADNGPADTGTPDAQPGDGGPPDAQPGDGGPPDAQPGDAQPGDVGLPDAELDAGLPLDGGALDGGPAICDIQVQPPETNAGQVGGPGGSPGLNLACLQGSVLIGVAVRISDNNTANGVRSAVGLTAICRQLRIGAPGVGIEVLQESMGTGQFGWSPATQSTLTRCPQDWIVSGLAASRGTSNNAFIDLTVTCSELQANGTTTGVTQDIYVMGSLMSTAPPDIANCPAGQAVSRIGTRVGAGFDQADVFCGPTACAP